MTCPPSHQGWIDESYNQLDEIKELIEAVPDPKKMGVLVLDVQGAEMPTKAGQQGW